MAPMASTLGVRIKNARKRKGLRQIDVARALGTTQATVCRWERGTYRPDWPMRAPLAELLELDADELVGAAP